MLHEALGLECSAAPCDRTLTDREHALTMQTPGGVRRAYECECGAVTVTVVREDAEAARE